MIYVKIWYHITWYDDLYVVTWLLYVMTWYTVIMRYIIWYDVRWGVRWDGMRWDKMESDDMVPPFNIGLIRQVTLISQVKCVTIPWLSHLIQIWVLLNDIYNLHDPQTSIFNTIIIAQSVIRYDSIQYGLPYRIAQSIVKSPNTAPHHWCSCWSKRGYVVFYEGKLRGLEQLLCTGSIFRIDYW